MKRLIMCCLLGMALYGNDTSETIYILSDSNEGALKYFNKRSSGYGNFSYVFSKDQKIKDDISYARPDNYEWNLDDEKKYELVFRGTNNYAYLQYVPETRLDTFSMDNGLKLIQLDGSRCIGQGCMQDEVVISAIVPDNYKVQKVQIFSDDILLKSSKYNLKVVGNTYTAYVPKIKGASMMLTIEKVIDTVYSSLSEAIQEDKTVELVKDNKNLRIIASADDLFVGRTAQLKTETFKWLNKLSKELKGKKYKALRIQGHTDSTPMTENDEYLSNWELSMHRATNVVKHMANKGFDSSKLYAVGYGDSKPVEGDILKDVVARNSRIEIVIEQ